MTLGVYKATEAMVANQQRGKAYRKSKSKSKQTKSYSDAYAVVSKSFVDSEFTLDEVKQLHRAINSASLEVTKYLGTEFIRDNDSLPTNNYLDYLESGGSAALVWCNEILQQEQIIKSYNVDLEKQKQDSITPENDRWSNISICKSVNQDLMQATYVVLPVDEVDLHGDIYNAEEVRKACHNFNEHCRVANLMHLVETRSFSIAESYVAPVDMILGETIVKAGSWLTVLQFYDKALWQDVKNGDMCGVSIGALANVQYLEEDENES